MPKKAVTDDTGIRIDKWLWCARFYKTRGLAADAIRGGKVMVNGMRVKPSKTVTPGVQLLIKQKLFEYEITIMSVPEKRLPAKDISTVYAESDESIEKRTMLAARYRTEAGTVPRTERKPGKHERRKIIRLRGKNMEL